MIGFTFIKKYFLIMLCIIVTMIYAVLLINKQNSIITLLYEIQRLQKKKINLQALQKNTIIAVQKEEQLSNIEPYAQHNLQMKPMHVSDMHHISEIMT